MKARVGIGGWSFAPWKQSFYPPGLPAARALAYASQHLTAIEINATFYRHQSPRTFAAWRDETPQDFVFTVKAHRACTHIQDLAQAGPSIDHFVASGLSELGDKLGPIFWQLPHNKKFEPAMMDGFLAALPAHARGVRLRHAVEARHSSFLDPAWPALAARHGAAIAIVDSDKQTLRGDVTADFVYARLQRNSAAAVEGYDSAALDAWAERIRRWGAGRAVADLERTGGGLKAGTKLACFVFFISGDKERAPDAAKAMLGRLGRRPRA